MVEAQVSAFVALLVAAALVGILVHRTPIPYATALALVGLAAGLVIRSPPFHLTTATILFVLIPGLLFEAAFNIKWRHLHDDLLPVIALATVGVLLTTAVIGGLGHLALGLSLPVALVLGAVV